MGGVMCAGESSFREVSDVFLWINQWHSMQHMRHLTASIALQRGEVRTTTTAPIITFSHCLPRKELVTSSRCCEW